MRGLWVGIIALIAQHAHCSGPRLPGQGTMEAEDCGAVGQCVYPSPLGQLRDGHGMELTAVDRVTAHTAIGDFDPAKDGFRHGARITPQAEKPTLKL